MDGEVIPLFERRLTPERRRWIQKRLGELAAEISDNARQLVVLAEDIEFAQEEIAELQAELKGVKSDEQ